MAGWKGKTRGGATGYQIFLWILKYLGLGFAYLVLRVVALYFFLFVPRSFRVMYVYFRRILGFGKWRTIAGIYRNYYVFGQIILDKFAVLGELQHKFTFDFDGEHHLQKMIDEQTGGILISGHVGNWEIAGAFLTRMGGKVNIVVFDGEIERIKKLTEQQIQRENVHFIALKPDYSHLFQISRALRNKELICIHGDRFLQGAKVSNRSFLGHPADFPMGPFELAARFDVPCSFVFAMRGTGRHYHFSATEGKVYDRNPGRVLTDFQEVFTQKVLQFPTQWFNYYEFWDREVYSGTKAFKSEHALAE